MKSPMLAASTDGKGLKLPMLASPKLDGVRALVIGGVVVSRKFKPIPNKHVQRLFGHAKFNGLDGELIAGDPCDPECYRATVSSVMSEGGEPDVTFHVFDDVSCADSSFQHRLDKVFERSKAKGLQCVTHRAVHTEDQLLSFEAECLARGYEGVMLRQALGPYKEGRSTLKEGWLLKLKRFEDSEAVILGMQEMMHNANEKAVGTGGQLERGHKKAGMQGMGVLGAFHVRDCKSGVEFDIGSGFTKAERELFWGDALSTHLHGKIIKYQFFPMGSKDKPRFPTFKGFRDPIDM